MKLVEPLVVLYPILSAYSIGGVFSDYGTILLSVYSFLYLILSRKFKIDKRLFWLTLYCQSSYTIWVVRNGDISSSYLFNIIVPFLYIIIISSVVQSINTKRLIISYHVIGLIASFVIIYQFVMLQVFGLPAKPITILPVADSDLHFWGDMLGERPSAFFSEPQAFASFLFPIYIIAWSQKKYILFFLYAIALLFSMSSLGIVVCFSVLLYYSLKGISFTRLVPLFVAFFICIMLFISGLMDESIEKILKTSLSDDIRLIRGFIILSYFSINDWLFGLGDGLLKFVVNSVKEPWVKIYLLESKHLLTYTSSFSGIIIRYGILGILLYMLLIRSIIRKLAASRLSLLGLLMLLLSFVQTIMFNSWFLFYLLIIYSISHFKIEHNE